MNNFKEGKLEIVIETGEKHVLHWKGKSEDRDPAALLVPYINGIIDSLKGKEVEVNFLTLEYMNSSTVPPIIHLVKSLNEQNIKSTIIYDANSKWQSASFKALETITKTLNTISVIGK